MLSRLSSYLEAMPSRAARVVVVLFVVIILMSTAILYQWLDLGDVFESPYPSETTSLNLVDGDVVWANQGISHFIGYTMNYSNISLRWMAHLDVATLNIGTYELANETQLAVLSTGSEATLTRNMSAGITVNGDEYFSLQRICVTDLTGNGLFDMGDYITFDFGEHAIPEDTVHTVALACVTDPIWHAEFSFAVHNGEFYTWRSSDLNWHEPWWERP